VELTSITEFWCQLTGTIHPADCSVLSRDGAVFNLKFPPPAFVGDVLRAPIIVLKAVGGYDPETTAKEFEPPDAADEYRQRLWKPRPSEPQFTAPYYQRGELWCRLMSGNACVVNAVPYRSTSNSVDDKVHQLARALASNSMHKRWLTEAIAPMAADHRRAVIVQHWGLWGLRKRDLEQSGFFYQNIARLRYPARSLWERADQWLDSA